MKGHRSRRRASSTSLSSPRLVALVFAAASLVAWPTAWPSGDFSAEVIEQHGRDSTIRIVGGCEQGPAPVISVGVPDRYLDAGEAAVFQIMIRSDVTVDDVVVTVENLVAVDADSPADCPPGSVGVCDDPDRSNNPLNGDLWFENPSFTLAHVVAGYPQLISFGVEVDPELAVTRKVEVLVGISAPGAADSLLAFRTVLNADEHSTFYSTDFPRGGAEVFDYDNSETVENPLTNANPDLDGRYESVLWSDLTAGTDAAGQPVELNAELQSPWNFDLTDGGFRVGVGAVTDYDTIHDYIVLWGEDLNFDNELGGYCEGDPAVWCRIDDDCVQAGTTGPCDLYEDRSPENGELDRNWSTEGGCGWHSKAAGLCSVSLAPCNSDEDCDPDGGECAGPPPATGGVWHTGLIRDTTSPSCLFSGFLQGRCQRHQTVSGSTGSRDWFGLLVSPVIQKVNRAVDDAGDPAARIEVLDWAWNQSIGLGDANATFTWEFDNDTQSPDVALVADLDVLGAVRGPYLPTAGSGNPPGEVGDPATLGGFPLFAGVRGSCALSTGISCATNADCPSVCESPNGGASCALDEDCGGVCPDGLTLCDEPGLPDADCGGGFCSLLECDNCTSAVDHTGSLGENRDPQNSCAFLGDDDIEGTMFDELAISGPPDDDLDNDGHAHCVGGTQNGALCDTPQQQSDCTLGGGDCRGPIDEFVASGGPLRNMNLTRAEGPDLRYEMLEDRIGDIADTFQIAYGFYLKQKDSPADPDPYSDFGAAIDDVKIEWREITLVPDESACAPGEPTLLSVNKALSGAVTIAYEPACAALDHHIEFGLLAGVGGYGYTGQECAIGSTGSHSFDPGTGDFFWILVANDGSGIEGSYGRDSLGIERPEDLVDPVCSLTQNLVGRCDAIFVGCSFDPPEVCDGVDNDCDGLIDPPGSGATCHLPHALPACINGGCSIVSCEPGYCDANGDPTDGCENACAAQVWNLEDSGAGSLRQAIDDAAPGETITFALRGTIRLTSGRLTIDKDLTIQGLGADQLAVDGGGVEPVFAVVGPFAMIDVEISGLTIRNGWNETVFGGCGGGVLTGFVNLDLIDSAITDNTALTGGGLCAKIDSNVEIIRCLVANNSAVHGGGIVAEPLDGYSVAVSIDTSTISGNTATGDGGGVWVATGPVPALSSTSSTIAENTAFGVAGGLVAPGIILTNNIIAYNSPIDCAITTPNSHGYNLDGDSTCGLDQPSDQPGIDPLLGPLADNGGPTRTHDLLGIPAIDSGFCGFASGIDQRGVTRPIDIPMLPNAFDGCDIGALEREE